MKLYTKILLFIAAAAAVSLLANVYFSRRAVSEAMSGQIVDAAGAAAIELAPDFRKALATGKELDGIKALHAFSRRTGALYAGLISPDGLVTAHTNVAMVNRRLDDPLMQRALRGGEAVFQRRVHGGETVVDAIMPIMPKPLSGEGLMFEAPAAGKPGWMRAGLPLAPALKAEGRITLNLLLLALAIAASAVVASAVFARLLLRQVSLLGAGIRKLRGGEFDAAVRVVARDELGEVAESFNKLCRDLSATTVSMQYLDSVLESLPDPLFITDEEGTIIKSNRAAVEFAGYDFHAREGRNIKDILEQPPESAAEPFSLLSWTGRINELDLWLKAGDGRRKAVMLSAAFIGVKGHRQVVILLKDTARHREAEARVAQYLKEVQTVNTELDSFAHTVSHDLKEPLRGIEMFSGMLISDYSSRLDPQAADYLTRISKAAGRMRRLIDDLLSYARISRVRNPYETVPLGRLAAEALAGLADLVEERHAVVAVQENMPEVYCDPVKFRQVFHNLLTNAVKYNDKPSPRVQVAAEGYGDFHCKISVKDDGIGIQPQYYEEIFRMFKRLHGRQDYGGGTGAGLAIVKKIVEEHGGRIWVESPPGGGSAFIILVPVDNRKTP